MSLASLAGRKPGPGHRSPRHWPTCSPSKGAVRDHDRHQTPWTSLLAWFLASFELGAEISYGYTLPEGGKIPGSSDTAPTASWIATPDGSWAEITLAADNGQHEVAEGGPRRMWHLVEQAHRT